jgi:hypothetical protein
MGFFGRLFGNDDDRRYRSPQQPYRAPQPPRSDDEIAVERYRYLLRTAPPDAIEQVHEEAFAKLTPEQRQLVFEQLKAGAAPSDRPAYDDPASLARAATRSELRQPGFLERTFGGYGGGGFGGGYGRSGPSFGSMLGGSLLGSIAGVVIGSAIADAMMPGIGDFGNDFYDGGADMGAGGFDGGGYDGGVDQAGFDGGGGGDWSGGGGDFGGGGGDFGGGMDV